MLLYSFELNIVEMAFSEESICLYYFFLFLNVCLKHYSPVGEQYTFSSKQSVFLVLGTYTSRFD